MASFPVLDLATAPDASRPALRGLQESFGFIPNIAGAMAASPTLLAGFAEVFRNAHAGTFTEPQIQVLLLTNAVTNACAWAVAFHSHLALAQGVAAGDVDAIRAGHAPAGVQDAALSHLARGLIERRGQVAAANIDAFLAAGFVQAQVLEVVLVVAASTITNYVGNIAQPPLEPAFQPHAWAAIDNPW